MITKLNTYEGVPIGGNNFSDFMDYIRGFLGANFGFSTNALTNEGGFFDADNFAYDTRSGAGGNEAVFFTPTGKEEGNFFGRLDTEYFRFNILTNDGLIEPQVYKWNILATENSSGNSQTILFENLSIAERQLPYRPLYKDSFGDYAYGYLDVRLNGIFQEPTDNYNVVYPYDGLNFSGQNVTFSRLRLGAESPLPVKDGRYDNTFIDPQNNIITREYFRDNYDSTLTFEHTNFSLDFGAHVLLWRDVSGFNRFSYIPQDLSSGEEVSPGTFKVLDYSRGTIKLNITNSQLQALVFDGETFADLDSEVNFTVVSAEQLKEENIGGVQYYYTRYGNIYNGESQDAILAEYIFDGNNNIVREIPQSDYFSGIGNLLLQDVNGRYTDGVVLGIKYYAIPNSEEFEEVQKNRYRPDTFQFYFHLGLVKSSAVPNTEVRCFLEQNPSSWYNRDVLDSEYFPVNRTDETYHTFLTDNEAGNVGFDGIFDPNQAFNIVDTIGLADLNDIGAIGPNQIILRNPGGTAFTGSNYTLAALLDTNITSPAENNMLRYSGGSWINSTRPLALQNIEGNISYTTTVSNNLGISTPSNTLVTKGYVDSLGGAVGGDISTHISNVGPNIHGATSTSTLGRLIIRDSITGRAEVERSGEAPTSTSKEIVNVDWIRFRSTNEATANTLARRDSSGRLRVANASNNIDAVNLQQLNAHTGDFDVHGATPSYTETGNVGASRLIIRDSSGRAQVRTSLASIAGVSNDIMNITWLTSKSGVFNTGNTFVVRDSNGKFYATPPTSSDPANFVATKGYVDASSGSSFTPNSQTAVFRTATGTSNVNSLGYSSANGWSASDWNFYPISRITSTTGSGIATFVLYCSGVSGNRGVLVTPPYNYSSIRGASYINIGQGGLTSSNSLAHHANSGSTRVSLDSWNNSQMIFFAVVKPTTDIVQIFISIYGVWRFS